MQTLEARKERGRPFPRAVSVFVGVAVVLALLAGAWRWRADSGRRELRSTEALLADAYAEQRLFELRLPDARYVAVKAQSNGDTSAFSRPVALLEAESRISKQLAKNSDDVPWLRLRARAEMLEQNYDDAISTLNRAADAQPDNVSLLADLGAAYALRARAGPREIDYSAAIEMLWRFLRKNPDSPVVLFNRALVYERMFLFKDAVQDWEHYLKLDHDGGWANEARSHKQALERRIAARQEAMKSLADAAGYRAAVKSGRAYDAEFYIEPAVTTWLPASATDAESREALVTLARLLREKHGDKWLEDLLGAKRDEHFWSGVAHLAEAVKQNLAGDHELALEEARQAERMYVAAGSRAGELLARYHEVYALSRSMEAKKCLNLVDQLVRETELLQYGWIGEQVLLEKGNCWAAAGDEGVGRTYFEQALREARGRDYKTLELRALGLLGGHATSLRNQVVAWQRITERLATYWEAPYSPIRAHQFYHDLSSSSVVLGHRYAAVIFGREAVEKISKTPYRELEAQTRSILAGLEDLGGLKGEAEREFSNAAELFLRGVAGQLVLKGNFSLRR